MSRFSRPALEAFLVLLLLGLVAAIVSLNPAASLASARPKPPSPPQPTDAPSLPAASPQKPKGVSPERLAALWGWKPPVGLPKEEPPPPPPPEPPLPPPVSDAPWLKLVGTLRVGEGQTSYYFKDTRSGRLIQAAFGIPIEGRTLVEKKDGYLILQENDAFYRIKE